MRVQIEKDIEGDNEIKSVYHEILSSENVRKIIEKKTTIQSWDQEETDGMEIINYDNNKNSNKVNKWDRKSTLLFKQNLITNFNQEILSSFQKFFSLENEISMNLIIVKSHIDKNLSCEFFSYINSLNLKHPKIKRINKKEKSFGTMIAHIPQASSPSRISSPSCYNKRINDCINNLYRLPEIKSNHFLNTNFVNKKTFEYRFHGTLNIRLNMNEYKKKFKLKPIKYDLDVEENLKIVDEILNKKKYEDKKSEKSKEGNNLLAETTSKYYIKLNRNILGKQQDENHPLKLKKTHLKHENNFFTNAGTQAQVIDYKKRILSSKYKIIKDVD